MSKDNTGTREQYAQQDTSRSRANRNVVTLRNCGFGVVDVDQSGWFVEIGALAVSVGGTAPASGG